MKLYDVALLQITIFLLFINVDAFFGFRNKFFLQDLRNETVSENVSTDYFEQRLDHFNPSDSRSWQQRYHVNTAYSNDTTKGRAYIVIGGEWEALGSGISTGSILDVAEHYGGIIFYLEHRFYGESQPLSDLSTANLRYLSSSQALEDLASFIQGMNDKYGLDSDVKWIAWGGSYAGTLAAWLRLKYPNLVHGAMSSSAPLEAVLDFKEYLQVVANALSSDSEACVTSIKNAYADLDNLVTSCLEDSDVYVSLDKSLTLCDSLELSDGNDKDMAMLFEILTDNIFAYLVQYHGRLGSLTIESVCGILKNESIGTELDRLGQVNTLFLNRSGDTCLEYKYDSILSKYANVTADSNSMMRQWWYQTCTEFGFFQTSSQTNPIFGSKFDVTFFTDFCSDLFGADFNSTLTGLGIESINNRFGGRNISVSNVVFVHGSYDPWYVLGVYEESEGSQYDTILIESASHCPNYPSESSTDSVALKAARTKVDRLIGEWFGINSTADNNGSNYGNLLHIPVFFLSAIVPVFVLIFDKLL